MKKIAIAIVASLAVFGASVSVATPASAAKSSYSKKENRLWKGMKEMHPLQAEAIGKKTTVKIANSSCNIFDGVGTDTGYYLISGVIAENAIKVDGGIRDMYIEYMVGTVVASTYTICKEHRSDLDKTIDNL
jgi:hypothetical protein